MSWSLRKLADEARADNRDDTTKPTCGSILVRIRPSVREEKLVHRIVGKMEYSTDQKAKGTKNPEDQFSIS